MTQLALNLEVETTADDVEQVAAGDGRPPTVQDLTDAGFPKDTARYILGPIVAHPGGWEVPAWLREAIPEARYVQVAGELAAGKTGDALATLEEVMAYLCTASPVFPFDHDWTTIYVYVFAQVVSKHRGTPASDIWRMLGWFPGL